jgi:hypothetical protein
MGATAPPAVSLQHPGNNRPAQEGPEPGCGCHADIDSDGKADILLKDPRRRFGEVNMRPLAPGFGNVVSVGVAGAAAVKVEKADIDGDGEDEIIVIDEALPNGGRVRRVDVDGDGDTDIVIID